METVTQPSTSHFMNPETGAKLLAKLLVHPVGSGAFLTIPKEDSERRIYFKLVDEVAEIIEQLGLIKYEPAVPALFRLHREMSGYKSYTVGEALFKIGSEEAHQALRSDILDSDFTRQRLAISSYVLKDPTKAFDEVSFLFTDKALNDKSHIAAAGSVFSFFGPSSYHSRGVHWVDPVVPLLLRRDDRWVQLALRFRRDRKLGEAARHLLRTLSSEEVNEALRRWPDPPAAPPQPYHGRRDFLERYNQGEYVQVWKELSEIGPFPDLELRKIAMAVANATMERVRENIALITARLQNQGYHFLEQDGANGQPWSPPSADFQAAIDLLEESAGGKLPLSLRAFWTKVGSGSWQQSVLSHPTLQACPRLKLGYEDPLSIYSPADCLGLSEEWVCDNEYHREVIGPLYLALAPDFYHKVGISGGPPYEILAANGGMDGILENEEHELPLIDYLRLSLKWGGFPRLENAQLTEPEKQWLNELTADLLPF